MITLIETGKVHSHGHFKFHLIHSAVFRTSVKGYTSL